MDPRQRALMSLEMRCKIDEEDFGIASQILNAYFPLLENAHRQQGYHFDKNFLDKRESHNLRLKNAKRILEIQNKIRELGKEFGDEERAGISLHLEYLAPIEGLISPELGFLIYTLVANGANYVVRGKSITDYEEITKTTLGAKVRFLKDIDFFPLITDNIDVDLRNAVGHMFYEISDTGEISVEGNIIDYERVYYMMRNIGYSLNLVLNVFYEQYVPE